MRVPTRPLGSISSGESGSVDDAVLRSLLTQINALQAQVTTLNSNVSALTQRVDGLQQGEKAEEHAFYASSSSIQFDDGNYWRIVGAVRAEAVGRLVRVSAYADTWLSTSRWTVGVLRRNGTTSSQVYIPFEISVVPDFNLNLTTGDIVMVLMRTVEDDILDVTSPAVCSITIGRN